MTERSCTTRQRIETLLVDGVKNVDEKKVLEVEN